MTESNGRLVSSFVQHWAEQRPLSTALEAPEQSSLSYADLWSQIESQVAQLREYGVRPVDRIALVIPNGAEAAAAFLTISSAASCAPLNPAFRVGEFNYYLKDLNVKAVVVQANVETPVRAAADELNLNIIELVSHPDAIAGSFTLSSQMTSQEVERIDTKSDDDALILHTSGTTSTPKVVPLTHDNLVASAESTRDMLQLNQDDLCLNIMPLFHIHGLMAATLASIAAGARIACMPGFYAPRFFGWLERYKPTWYTGVPTMHQAILERAEKFSQIRDKHQLRFIRSCSAALPPKLMGDLERTFGIPVIEAYGMTEASHQITSNPLPPLHRKAGSVGQATGVEVSIMDQSGKLIPQGEPGEIVVKGQTVIREYEGDREANRQSFVNDWFRTGDLGYLDLDGYLFVTGRLKEVINRGGQKISPREIDEVLLDHPAVYQTAAFAMPDTRLGEEIAAAVVLRDSRSVSEKELRAFVAERVADFKVPKRVLIVGEIPKGPTGKLQRTQLADRLGLTTREGQTKASKPPFAPPRNAFEEALARIWSDVLEVEQVGIHDRFLDLGGDSMLATLILSRVQGWLETEISMIDFFDAATVSEQAQLVQASLLAEFDKGDAGE